MNSHLHKQCTHCKRSLPVSKFERRMTALQVVRDYDRHKNSNVEEFTEEDRAWARAQNEAGKPTTLTRFKHIASPLVESAVCLECRPQAPFEGKLATVSERLNAVSLGVFAPTQERSRKILEALLKERSASKEDKRGDHLRTLPVVIRRRMRALVSNELRSARNKAYNASARRAPMAPYLESCISEYGFLVGTVHKMLTSRTDKLPAIVWQLVLRGGPDVLQHAWVPAIVAMGWRSPAYRPVSGALVQMVQTYRRYTATAPKNQRTFHYLALADSQENSIREMHAALVHASPELNAQAGPRAALLAGDRGLRRGIPALDKLLESELDRIEALDRLLSKPHASVPEDDFEEIPDAELQDFDD